MEQYEAYLRTLSHISQEAEEHPSDMESRSAIGEVEINGVWYQIQLSLVSKKEHFLGENDVLRVAAMNMTTVTE